MATLRNKRKLATVARETQEEHLSNGQSRNTSIPRINEKFITQVPEEIKSRLTKKLAQEFNRTESRILGALSKLDELLLNPHIRTLSGTVPGTFRNTNVENQKSNGNRSPFISLVIRFIQTQTKLLTVPSISSKFLLNLDTLKYTLIVNFLEFTVLIGLSETAEIYFVFL